MTDFETHPIGTAKRIAAPKAKLRQEVKDKARVERVWGDNYAALEAKLATAVRALQFIACEENEEVARATLAELEGKPHGED